MNLITQGLIVIYLQATVLALIGYDCDSPATNISSISLRDVAPCPDYLEEYVTESKFVDVLQKRDIDRQHVFTCLMEVTRIITRCGMFSHNSFIKDSLLTYIHKMGAEGCSSTHKHGEYRGIHGHIIGSLVSNSTTSASITLAGQVDLEGKCVGTTFVEHGNSYQNVVVIATTTLRLSDYWSKVSLDTNEILLQNGIGCPYLDGYCLDSTFGETVWSTQDEISCSKYDIAYSGPATLLFPKPDSKLSVDYLVVEEQDKIFALSLIKKTQLCLENIYLTEHPKLILVIKETSKSRTYWTDQTRSPEADLLLYTNTKFLYVEQSFKRSIDKLNIHTMNRRCELRREILKNRLLLAQIHPNAVAALVKNQLGYVGRVSGEVLFILQCIPKIVKVRRETRCFHELPVLVENSSMFLSPVNRILQKHAQEIDCSFIIPPLYFIGDQWVGFSPHPVQGFHPRELQVDIEARIPFNEIQNTGVGGLYSEEEISKAIKAVMFNIERDAVSNIILRKVSGHSDVDNQGYSTVNIFSKEELSRLTMSAVDHLWGIFNFISRFSAGFLGCYFIFRVFKSIIEIMINALAIHREGLGGLKFLGAFWDTITYYIIHSANKAPKVNKSDAVQSGVVIEAQKEEATAPVISPYAHLLEDVKIEHQKLKTLSDKSNESQTFKPLM